jgi:alpha-L-fucosidase
MKKTLLLAAALVSFILPAAVRAQTGTIETAEQYAARMRWWKEARFGLFIHWGLYSIPAGEWNGETDYGEWIRTSAHIPVGVYDSLLGEFNPVKFDAREWVRLAKDAGMRYITITTKHHDGFCLFDSKAGDFNVMATPFKRDIMKELSDACRGEGIAVCWYHSIMDWHHPDYLPRRDWEKDRSAQGADFDRYVAYLKRQLRELTTNYGKIGVLWFDGEWEGTWNRERGRDLYDYVRGLQPGIIINNRVGAGRSGMEGFSEGEPSAGDFGTPEQQVPATGLPGVYWETCMTMNDHWGYNRKDTNWKSSSELIRTLADIASKGGNFLLNVGPTAEGVFPPASVERLRDIGRWMKVNSEAIYGTDASPFAALPWGRCTRKETPSGTRLYLHVFDWPAGGRLAVPGIFNRAKGAYLLSDAAKTPLAVSREEDALLVTLPARSPDTVNAVVVLDLEGTADVADPPVIDTTLTIFIDTKEVAVTSERKNVEIRYTTDGSVPSAASQPVAGPVTLSSTATLSARCFREGKPVSGTSTAEFHKVLPRTALEKGDRVNGVAYRYYQGDWDSLPDFSALRSAGRGTLPNFSFAPRTDEEHFGFEYTGYIEVPGTGVYTLSTESDDGSRLFIGNELVVDNDGLHGMARRSAAIALSAGLHPVRVQFFEKTGGDGLVVSWEGPGFGRTAIPDSALFIDRVGR